MHLESLRVRIDIDPLDEEAHELLLLFDSPLLENVLKAPDLLDDVIHLREDIDFLTANCLIETSSNFVQLGEPLPDVPHFRTIPLESTPINFLSNETLG